MVLPALPLINTLPAPTAPAPAAGGGGGVGDGNANASSFWMSRESAASLISGGTCGVIGEEGLSLIVPLVASFLPSAPVAALAPAPALLLREMFWPSAAALIAVSAVCILICALQISTKALVVGLSSSTVLNIEGGA